MAGSNEIKGLAPPPAVFGLSAAPAPPSPLAGVGVGRRPTDEGGAARRVASASTGACKLISSVRPRTATAPAAAPRGAPLIRRPCGATPSPARGEGGAPLSARGASTLAGVRFSDYRDFRFSGSKCRGGSPRARIGEAAHLAPTGDRQGEIAGLAVECTLTLTAS